MKGRKWISHSDIIEAIERFRREFGDPITEFRWERWKANGGSGPSWPIVYRWRREYPEPQASNDRHIENAKHDLHVYLRKVLSTQAYDEWARAEGRMRANEVTVLLGGVGSVMGRMINREDD